MLQPVWKVCGNTSIQDVTICSNFGVDVLGFVTEYPVKVPWNLSANEALKLIKHMPYNVKSCVVTGGSVEKVYSLAVNLKTDFIQLHYNETLEETSALSHMLADQGIKVIKTIPLVPERRRSQLGTEELCECVKRLELSGVYAILVDARSPENASREGRAVDLKLFAEIKNYSSIPVILAGGLTADNLRGTLDIAQPKWIDVMTGVECSPGKKDIGKVKTMAKVLGRI